jgi:hypothetical protein
MNGRISIGETRERLDDSSLDELVISYVGFDTHDFSSDIEMREKAGTPPILQTIKAALAMELKRARARGTDRLPRG